MAQRVILVPSRRTYPRREFTREVAKLSADSHRRRAASTMLSPVPGLATFLRRAPRFRTAFLLLAAFVTRCFAFLATIAAAPCSTFPPHSSVRPCAGQVHSRARSSLSSALAPGGRRSRGRDRQIGVVPATRVIQQLMDMVAAGARWLVPMLVLGASFRCPEPAGLA